MQDPPTTSPDAGALRRVAFHFDVLCPFAYQTSLWIREVRGHRPVEIEWRFFSLEEVNREEGRKHPWERPWSHGWGLLRVAALLRRHSMDACDRFYAAAGRALHVEGRKAHDPEVARALVAEIGLDPGVGDKEIDDPTTPDDVRADHDSLLARGGFGVPTLVFDGGPAVYGPVVAPAPTGDDALALWDLTLAYRRIPHLYELKTPKSDADLEHITRVFTPYLKARDWESREKPAP